MKILDWSTALASWGGAGRADCLPAGEEVLRERETRERAAGGGAVVRGGGRQQLLAQTSPPAPPAPPAASPPRSLYVLGLVCKLANGFEGPVQNFGRVVPKFTDSLRNLGTSHSGVTF